MDEYQWISGIVAVEAVLRSNSREVVAVHIDKDRYDGPAARLQQLARASGIPVSRIPSDELEIRVSDSGAHGGVIAQVGPRRTSPMDGLFSAHRPVIFLLDGVEDPYNFGQAVRSIFAAGIDGLIVPPRNWLSAAATVIRASAGATELIPTAVSDTSEAVLAARSRGLRVAVATHEKATPMYESDLSGPLLLVIGGEKRGVTRLAQEVATLRVSIPYGRSYDYSLGTAAAAAVLAFECMHQRHHES